MAAGLLKIYDINRIRGHKISNVEPGKVRSGELYAPGIRGNIQSASVNIGSAIRDSIENARMLKDSEDESGLFISVKDIDYPVWHIRIYDEYQQNRWHEILSQLYEGTLSQAN